MKRFLKIIFSISIVILLGCLYLQTTFYKADESVTIYIGTSSESIQYVEKNGYICYEVDGSDTALVFYPGGFVNYDAYCVYGSELAKQGISVYICKMPMDLAVLKINAANKLFEDYPDIKNWYIAGHSLGGAMAATYLNKNAEKFKGLILLAAYSTTDLTDTDLKVLSIYGTNDQVMKKDKYEKYYANLPNLTEVIIEGGNHCYFGNYGHQKGDGEASITQNQQLEITIDAIKKFVMQ